MRFKYSICYPNKEDIEYHDKPISGDEALEIAKNYPWEQQLNLFYSLDEDKICFNPSLDFGCLENGLSFCLTAEFDKTKELQFSLWYNRPKKVKTFFGLFGESEKMIVDDVRSYNLQDSLSYLKSFVEGEYQQVEKLFN
jgi:hypothetical protein